VATTESMTTVARSRLMGAVRQRGTAPELVVRRLLTDIGVKYRLNVAGLPGTPDLANQTRRFVVFVDGCFWHRHPGCSRTTTPKGNRKFWLSKFEANVARDRRNRLALRRLGYSVIVIWECETVNLGRLDRRLRRLLAPGHNRR
jgi:DNA mismatch endonuclease (patch repair protein)